MRRHDKKRSFVSNYCGASHKLVAKLFCLLAFYIMPLFFILSVYKKLYTVWFMTALFFISKKDFCHCPFICYICVISIWTCFVLIYSCVSDFGSCLPFLPLAFFCINTLYYYPLSVSLFFFSFLRSFLSACISVALCFCFSCLYYI